MDSHATRPGCVKNTLLFSFVKKVDAAYKSLVHCLFCYIILVSIPLFSLSVSSQAFGAYELCFCDRTHWEGYFGQLYNGCNEKPAQPMHRSQQPIRIGYTELVIELVITVYGPSCTFLELIFPCHQGSFLRTVWHFYIFCLLPLLG